MRYLWYFNGITRQTGEKLAEELDINSGGEAVSGVTKLIRWGNGCDLGYTPRVIINKQTALRKAIDKSLSMRLFNEAGVRIPELSSTVPCVGRQRTHTQGQGFWLCWELGQVATARQEGAEYFIKYIPVKQEWRVHVIDGDIAFVQRKYAHDRISTAYMGIQGFRDAWHKQVINPNEAGVNVCLQATKAVQALGLDFGGVDVVISVADNRPYVLEVNTGPALPTEETRRPYIEYFRRRLE